MFGQSLLHLAIMMDDYNSVALLLELGANVNQRATGRFFQPESLKRHPLKSETDYKGKNFFAQKMQMPPIVQKINSTIYHHYTLLHTVLYIKHDTPSTTIHYALFTILHLSLYTIYYALYTSTTIHNYALSTMHHPPLYTHIHYTYTPSATIHYTLCIIYIIYQ
jgi:hypothetical protein